MRARDVMSVNLITVSPNEPVRKAVALMLEHRISGLPVVDSEGALVGLLTENDLVMGTSSELPVHLQLLEDLLEAREPTRHLTQVQEIGKKMIRDLMVEDLVTAGPDTPVGELIALLVKNDFKRIPIVSGGKLEGIVTRADIVKIMQ